MSINTTNTQSASPSGLVEAVRAAMQTADFKRGEVTIHGSAWLKITDALTTAPATAGEAPSAKFRQTISEVNISKDEPIEPYPAAGADTKGTSYFGRPPSAAPATAGEGDNCQLCYGANGGVRGNENRIGALVVCDYCTVKLSDHGLAPTPSASGEAGPTPLQAASRIVADFRPEGWPSKRNEIATYLERHFVPRTALQSTPPTDAVREALEPVWHWYQSDEHPERPLAEIVADVVADLQQDRAWVLNPPKHKFWMPGEADCPREIKAGNGELHTLRCKVCGQDSPREDYCRAALSAHPAPVEWLERALDIVNVVEGNIRGSHADQADRLMELWRILYALRPNTESGRTPVAPDKENSNV